MVYPLGMPPSHSLLRRVLTFQGIFLGIVNLWALLVPAHFLSFANPLGTLFQAQSFAALSLVLAIYFLVGAWREDLLRPAAFLGLGSAIAIVLVELFYLPGIGWTLLWFDLIVEASLAGAYITLFFFNRNEKPEESIPSHHAEHIQDVEKESTDEDRTIDA